MGVDSPSTLFAGRNSDIDGDGYGTDDDENGGHPPPCL